MKKRAVKILSLMMTATFLTTNTFVAQAAPIKSTVKKDVAENKEEAIFKDGQALVLYKSSNITTKNAANRAVNVSGASVEKLWNFESSSKAVKSSSKSQSTDTVAIGLVTSNKLSTEQLVEKLSEEENVAIAEPNYRVHKMTTNDMYSESQWSLKTTNVEKKWAEVAETGATSKETVVAVVDTGVDYTHEDLKDSMWVNEYQPELRGEYGMDFVNGDTDPADDEGHGSHCAGIIAASKDNNVGISGMAPDVKIMALKTLDFDGSGYASQAIDAYNYINKAMNLGVNVVAINNSWGSSEESKILKKLIDLVGEKGAISVCAAGNSGANTDEEAEYPAASECAYNISVASVKESGTLNSFSNYGKETVDIAAPGNNILSTVTYECYNPSIYPEEKQDKVSQYFENFNAEGVKNESGFWNPENITIQSDKKGEDNDYQAELTESENFGPNSGKSLQVSLKNMEAGEVAAIHIPYTISEGVNAAPRWSMMVKTSGPKEPVLDFNLLMLGEISEEEEPSSIDEFLNYDEWQELDIDGEAEDWTHFEVQQTTKNPETGERAFYLVIYAGARGDYTVWLDDIGLSAENVDTSEFGKYEFYSGTSMATPHVTAAVALEAMAHPELSADDRVENVLRQVNTENNLPVASGGVLDYSAEQKATRPRIHSVKSDESKGTITIAGTGFDGAGLKVEVLEQGNSEAKEAKILKSSAKEIVINGTDYMNRIITLTVTANDKKATKKEYYVADSKTAYKEIKNLFVTSSDVMTSDGRYIYFASSQDDSISVLDTSDLKDAFEDILSVVKPEKIFSKDKNSQGTYDFRFGKDLVYADGMLYNIGAYSEVQGGEDEEDDYYDEEYGYSDDTTVAYSSQYKLLSIDANTGKVKSLGALPKSVKRTEDWTLTSYNGKLYLIGGYDYGKKSCSTSVQIYDPATKKWSAGPSLPEGRAGGKAIQTGNKLVYTLGYGAAQEGVEVEKQTCPATLVLSGKKWTTSKQSLQPYSESTVVHNGSKSFKNYQASIALCAEGVVYVGTPMAGLGDTFIYNVAKDKYTSTKYGQIKEMYEEYDEWFGENVKLQDETYQAAAVGSKLIIFDQYGLGYQATVRSGLVKVSASKYKNGKITGANKSVLPGTEVKLTAKANKGYGVKEFKVDGKKVSGKSKTLRLTSNIRATATFGKLITKLSLKDKNYTVKAGNKVNLKVTVAPKDAANKKLSYKSSNTKYATVSSTGVVTTKKAGKGKTVTITVRSTDGSNKKVTCKIKIQ